MELSTPKFDPKKILIILHGSLGDVTRALPLADSVRKGFPRAFVAWSIEPAALPLLQDNRAIDEIIVFERQRGWRAFGPFLAQIRVRKFDLVLDLQRHLKSGLISWCSGARHRIGFNRADAKEMNWIFNNLHLERFGNQISKLDHYLKFAEYLGVPQQPVDWNFALSTAEQASVSRCLADVNQPFAVLFIGTRWESKQWFPVQIARSAELLRGEYRFAVVLLGGKEDQDLAAAVVTEARVPVVNLVGRTSLREAIGVIERASLAIGPDTGLMHIAAAVRTPVISLWGATDPQRTGPYGFADLIIQGRAPCVPCHRRTCNIGRVCMKSITSAEIAAKIATAVGLESTNEGRYAERI